MNRKYNKFPFSIISYLTRKIKKRYKLMYLFGGQEIRTSSLIVDFKAFFHFTRANFVQIKYHHIMLYIVIKLQIFIVNIICIICKEQIYNLFLLSFYSFKVYSLISGSINIVSSTLSNLYSFSVRVLPPVDLTNNPVSFSIYVSVASEVKDVDDINPFML